MFDQLKVRHVMTIASFLVLTVVGAEAQGEVAVVDGKGQIAALSVEGETLDVQVSYRIPLKGWGKLPGPWDAKGVKVTRDGEKISLRGRVELEPGKSYAVEQTIDDREDVVTVRLTFTAQAEVETEGVYLWIDVPIDRFAGGACELRQGDRIANASAFPLKQPAQRHFLRGNADGIKMCSPKQDAKLDITFDRAIHGTVQDTREWKGTKYSAFFRLAPALKRGQSTSLAVTIRPSVRADTSPANLALDATSVRYRLDGFGGNYCFGIESPITQYTLKNLDIAWARTEMTPYEWEPENDNDSPSDTDWKYLSKHDKPDSNLRREFLLAKQIQDMGVPYVISIWALPKWLYENPPDRVRQSKRRIHPDKWDELLECLGSYLVYAKREYGVEPRPLLVQRGEHWRRCSAHGRGASRGHQAHRCSFREAGTEDEDAPRRRHRRAGHAYVRTARSQRPGGTAGTAAPSAFIRGVVRRRSSTPPGAIWPRN